MMFQYEDGGLYWSRVHCDNVVCERMPSYSTWWDEVEHGRQKYTDSAVKRANKRCLIRLVCFVSRQVLCLPQHKPVTYGCRWWEDLVILREADRTVL